MHTLCCLVSFGPAGLGCTTQRFVIGEVTVAPIDSRGGEAKSADGLLVVTIPEGAIPSRTNVTIRTHRESTNPDLIRPIYELGPSGLTCARPVELVLRGI